MAHILKLFRRLRLVQDWAPLLLWMTGIFYFSSRPNPLSFLPSPEQRGSVGKVAHFAEYAGLAALLYRALSNGGKRQTSSGFSDPPDPSVAGNPGATALSGPWPAGAGRSLLVSFTIGLAYAILDELHQELVPGRGFALTDIGCDLAGMTTALGLIWLWKRRAPVGANGPRQPS
jgi:VanZ family protein